MSVLLKPLVLSPKRSQGKVLEASFMARDNSNRSPFMGGKSGKPLREDAEKLPLDYDLPLNDPPAKEMAKSYRPDNFVLNLKVVNEPTVEIFLDQLPAFRGKEDANFVFMIARGKVYRFYVVPFKKVIPLLQFVPLSQEKRQRWRLFVVPSKHKLVGRNGSKVENIDNLTSTIKEMF